MTESKKRPPGGKSGHGALTLALLAAAPTAADAQTPAGQPLYAGRLDAFLGKSLEQKVQELADREEIRDLIATYAHRAARGLPLADLYTDDGVFINRGAAGRKPSETRGRAALDKTFGDNTGRPEQPLPMIHNYLIAVNGDEATCVSSVEIRVVESGVSIVASGYYNDRFRREDGRWKFTERDITFFHYVPLQEGWAKPAAGK